MCPGEEREAAGKSAEGRERGRDGEVGRKERQREKLERKFSSE